MTKPDLKWRNDRKSHDNPTMDFVVIQAEDLIDSKRNFNLIVCHIQTLRGRGFMASVRSLGGMHNDGVCYGTDETAYQAAVARGRKILDAEAQRLNQENDKLQRQIRR